MVTPFTADGDLDVGSAALTLDGGASLVPGHSRHQVLSGVDGLGQAGKLRAVAEKVRAHRQHDVDRARRLRGGLKQQAHKSDGILSRTPPIRAGAAD